MKKQIVLATGLALMSTSAFATKARMQGLGQDQGRGSFYIDDSRNIFRNAAHVNSMKNYIVTEWGVDSTAGADADAAPQAEGGVFKEAGNFAWGLYMGSTLDHQNATRTGTATTTSATVGEAGFLNRDNQLDLFFGGDMGVEWGANLSYAKGNSKTTGTHEKKQSALGLNLGVLAGDLSAWANLGLSDKSEGASASGDKWEADLGLRLGASYDISGMTVFAEYAKTGAEYTDAGATFKPTVEDTTIQVGVGRTYEHSATSRMFAQVAYESSNQEGKVSTTQTNERTSTSLPVTFGFETDANSWLTVRGSISQDLPIMNKVETKTGGATPSTTEATDTNTANINAGATLNFGKLKVDGVIGNDGNAGETGLLTLDHLMTRVSVHYWF